MTSGPVIRTSGFGPGQVYSWTKTCASSALDKGCKFRGSLRLARILVGLKRQGIVRPEIGCHERRVD